MLSPGRRHHEWLWLDDLQWRFGNYATIRFGWQNLDGRTLINNGTATWSGTGINRLFGSNGAVIRNGASATFAILSDGELLFGTGARPTFVNAGQFTKSGGSGSTTVQYNFNNSGTVEAQSGS